MMTVRPRWWRCAGGRWRGECGGVLQGTLQEEDRRMLLLTEEHMHKGSRNRTHAEDTYGDYSIRRPKTSVPKQPQTRSITNTPCETMTQSSQLSDSDPFYSTFHNTPDRRKITKDEWDKFTKESTKRVSEKLVSSPDFNGWAVARADRIALLPPKEVKKGIRWSWLSWS